MAFRERLRRTFSRRKSSSSRPSKSSKSSTASGTSQSTSATDPSDRSSSIWYQPGEKIPYKYRRPVDPEHKATLESFSWTNGWRRRSQHSQYSPFGSRMPSRQGSAAGPSSNSKLRKSIDQDGQMPPHGIHGTASAAYAGVAPSELTPIESVPTTRMEPADMSQVTTQTFSQKELDAALKKSRFRA